MKTIFISDSNSKIWDSGLATEIQDKFKWWNVENGFKAIVTIEFYNDRIK